MGYYGYTLQQTRQIRNNYYRKRSEKQRRISKLCNEIERLEEAKRFLENLEDGSIKQLVHTDIPLKRSAADLSWRGGLKDAFDAYVSGETYQNGVSFRESVDEMTDALNNEIRRRKAERENEEGCIISYNNTIGRLTTAIANWFD